MMQVFHCFLIYLLRFDVTIIFIINYQLRGTELFGKKDPNSKTDKIWHKVM